MDLKYYLSKRQVAGKRGNKRNWILKMNFAWKSKTKQRMVFRIVHIKDSRSYLWAKFGLWTPWVCLGWYEKRSMHYYLEPVCPLFLKINPLKQGRISNQKQGSFGFQVYIYTSIIYRGDEVFETLTSFFSVKKSSKQWILSKHRHTFPNNNSGITSQPTVYKIHTHKKTKRPVAFTIASITHFVTHAAANGVFCIEMWTPLIWLNGIRIGVNPHLHEQRLAFTLVMFYVCSIETPF